MRRKINIFLASSIVEFANERMAIENFIRNISDSFEEQYDVKLQPLLCENFDGAYSEVRKQEEYNQKIRSSEFCFFIFFTKAGEYTREEFEVARAKFEETGKPKIYTYFKILGETEGEQSLYNFMEELDKTFGHYYSTFDHVDTIKLRILMNLKLQEMDFLEIKAEDGACIVDGKKVLSLENVSEFANNEIFKEMKAELEVVEKEYFALKAKYEEDNADMDLYRRYADTATKRKNLLDSIEELRKEIFNMSLRMCEDKARGEITVRQKEAYRLFEAGDLEGANRILDFAEIRNEYLRRKAIREAEQKKDAQIFIREGRTKIDILSAMTKLSTRFEEIEEIFDEITEVAFEEEIELDVVYHQVWFFYRLFMYEKAYEAAKKLKHFYGDKATDVEMVKLFDTIGIMCSFIPSRKEEGKEYYLSAIEIYKKLFLKDPLEYGPKLESVYVRTAYESEIKDAEAFYLKGIEVNEYLVKFDREKFLPEVESGYSLLGGYMYTNGEHEKAKKYYLISIEFCEILARENPKEYEKRLHGRYYDYWMVSRDESYKQKAREIEAKYSYRPMRPMPNIFPKPKN